MALDAEKLKMIMAFDFIVLSLFSSPQVTILVRRPIFQKKKKKKEKKKKKKKNKNRT